MLLSPFERYVRVFLPVTFNNQQTLEFSSIEFNLKFQAGAGRVLNGFYVVHFMSNLGNYADKADLTVNNTPYIITHNDYLICRYFRNVLVNVQFANDKTNVNYSIFQNTLEFHTRQIDTLKQKLDTLKVPNTEGGNYWNLAGNTIGENEFLGTKNSQDVRFKTNNTQRVIFNRNGKNGFGVTDPTQEIDALNYRNRGSYYDGFNNSGKQGQVIVSIIEGTKTAWSDNYKFTQLEHTAPDNAVLTGLSKSVAVVPYAHYKLRSITFSTQEAPTANMRIRVWYRRTNTAIPQSVAILTYTFPATFTSIHENFVLLNGFFNVEHGSTFRVEVVNSGNNSAKGLAVVFGFSEQ